MKYWKPEIIEVTNIKKIVGVINGSVIVKNCLVLLTPAISAASYKCFGILFIAPKKNKADTPDPQADIKIKEILTMCSFPNQSIEGILNIPKNWLIKP